MVPDVVKQLAQRDTGFLERFAKEYGNTRFYMSKNKECWQPAIVSHFCWLPTAVYSLSNDVGTTLELNLLETP